MAIPEFELSPMVRLFDILGQPSRLSVPVPMEKLGQAYGFIVYEHTADNLVSSVVHPTDRPRDRVQVFVNGTTKGVIDGQYQPPLNISVTLRPQDKLQLLIENLGSVGYYARGNRYDDYLRQPHKGIVGDVMVGEETIRGWDLYPKPLQQLPSRAPKPYGSTKKQQIPMFYNGFFNTAADINADDPAELDTYLVIPNGAKGQVFVNGFNLGHYWLVGPQQSLY